MQNSPFLRKRKRALCLLILAGAAGALPLAGCSSPVDRAVATMSIPSDYHLRHTVVLADAPQRLDIFFVGTSGHLDYPEYRQLEVFARNYRDYGQGVVRVAVPRGPVDHYAADMTLTAVRKALLHFGVRRGIAVDSYPVADPALASPLHLSYVKLQARPTTQCGDWPDDLGSGNTLDGWQNRSYYNLGCASQSTLTAQVADPRDLVKPRAEDPTDVQLRTRAIQLLRAGEDPSTGWGGSPPLIGTVGGF